jgi:hypothetical protein
VSFMSHDVCNVKSKDEMKGILFHVQITYGQKFHSYSSHVMPSVISRSHCLSTQLGMMAS